MREFQPFEMERLMSQWEQRVEFNLSESGVHPLRLGELVEGPELERLLATELGYPEVNGTLALRQRIAALYGAEPDQILVTVGCAEALQISFQTLFDEAPQAQPEAVVMMPNYLHAWGMARNLGFGVRELHLRGEAGWRPDTDELDEVVSERTRVIAVCNPNNPTGYILSAAEMEAIVAAAERVGAWILADEVYAGAERTTEVETPSFWGRYPRVLALNSLSKAYGLPGLRLGWVVAPRDMVGSIWRRHEYSTLATTMLANRLAERALSEETRPRILERTRRYVRRGYEQLEAWLDGFPGRFDVTPPAAAAIAFVRHHLPVDSPGLVDRLIREKSVLVVPGEHFGVPHHVRISFGPPREYLAAGLARIAELVGELARGSE